MAGKRANGEGSVFRRDDGRWVAAFSYTDPITGRRKRSDSYGTTAAKARAAMKAKRERLDAGLPVKDARVSLAAFTTQWLATTLAASDRKATTKATYSHLARGYLIAEPFGAITLDRLSPSDVERLVLTMRDAGKAESTVRQTYTVLRSVLDAAVRDGVVGRNVAALVKRPGVSRRDARFLTPGELRRLFAGAEGSRYAPLLHLLAYTGLRRGEALALRWVDVDFDNRLLHVRGTLARIDGSLTITEPKSERSRRAVPMPERVVALLREHRAAQAAERLHAGPLWAERGFVFATEAGEPVDPRNALRALSVAAQKAGLAGVGLHTLRHSAASAMLGAGVSLKAVSDTLGHSSIAITGDVYGHLAPEVQRAALDALAEALGE